MAAGSMLIRGVQFDIVTERRPHSSSFETDTSDQATADEFFSEDEPTPPQGTDVVDLPFDVPLKPDRSVLPPPEVVPHERFDGPSSEDTAVLPVVKVDVAADVDGPLEDLPVPAGRISPVSPVNPISPDPPDPSAFAREDPSGSPRPTEASTPTGQIDALTPEAIAAFASATDDSSGPSERADQHGVLPSDADPTAVTTVVNAVLAEDDLAPLDPDDGAQTPPTIGQPEPDAEAGRPPVAPTGEPAAPATAEFSLSDIASQGEPDRAGDTPLPPPSLGNEPWRIDEDVPQPETAQIEAVEIQPVEPETAQIEAVEIQPVEPETAQIEAVEIQPVEIQPVEVEAVQLEAADLEPARTEGVEPGTIDLESDKIQSDEIESSEIKPEIENESFKFEFESLEFATVEPETTQSRAEPPKVEGPNDATAPPKQRGLFRRRRDRRRAALNEAADRGRLDAVREKPTTEDEPVFISAREPLFTEPEPDSAPADEPRPRRNVTLPPDITPPDSWVEPAQAEPNEPLDGPTVAATTPFDTDEGLFADRLPPSDSPATPNHEETIGWRSDEPETAPLGQRFDLFKEEHEPQVDPEDETTPTSTAEAITGPPTEAEDHTVTAADIGGEHYDEHDAGPPTEAEDHGVTDADTGDEHDDGPPTNTEDHTATDHDIGDHDIGDHDIGYGDIGPPNGAIQQTDTDTDTDIGDDDTGAPTEATRQIDAGADTGDAQDDGPPTDTEDHTVTDHDIGDHDTGPPTEAVQQIDTDSDSDTDIGDAQEANPAIGAEDHTGVDFDIDTDIGDAQDDGPPTDTEDHTVTDHDIGDHDTGPPTEATQQIDTDTPDPHPVDGDWVSEGADGGWSELDQAHTDHDEDPGSETDSNLVLFPDEFPPLPLDDSSPSAPGLTSELNTDWASIPLDDQSALDSPDNLSLFTTDEPPSSDADRLDPQPRFRTDSEFFSLETMLAGLPEPDESAGLPLTSDRTDVAPDHQRDRTPDPTESVATTRPPADDFVELPVPSGRTDVVPEHHRDRSPDPTESVAVTRPLADDFVELAELPEEPGRLLEGAATRPTPRDDVFGELAELDDRFIDDRTDDEPDEDRVGERVERHDWWDYDDTTQRNDDRGGFRAAANATEAINLNGTEQMRLEASDLAAPPTSTKPSDLDALDGPDSDAYEAALYAFFDAPNRDEHSADEAGDSEIDPEYDDGPTPKARGKGERKRKRSKTRKAEDTSPVETDLFVEDQALVEDDRDDVDRWVEGTTDTHADWLERSKRSTFANLLGLLIALAAVIGVVLATIWVVSNI